MQVLPVRLQQSKARYRGTEGRTKQKKLGALSALKYFRVPKGNSEQNAWIQAFASDRYPSIGANRVSAKSLFFASTNSM